MPTVRSCFAVALSLSLAAASAACGSNNGPGPGHGGSTTTGTTTTGTTTTSTTGTTSSSTTTIDPTTLKCESCLAGACAAEKAACNADCYSIQACLDAVCAHLSATAAATEGACQTYCEGLHPNGKAPLLAYVNCAQGAACEPPCAVAPYDYEQCAAAQTAGACKSASDACAASSDCTSYQACAGACTTDTACEACGMGTSGSAGEKLYESLQLCIDQTCLPLYWLPNI